MPLRVARDGRVAVLTLDDPERRNALTDELVAEIVVAVSELETDERVGALVVTGAPPAFCSGADVGNLAALSGATADRDRRSDSALRSIYEGFLRVYRCTLPTFAAVNGPAVGAGFNLALACDVRIVSPQARFDSRFARLGIHPGGGHTRLLVEIAGPQAAAAMVLAGQAVDGPRAVELGLAWQCVPDALTSALEVAERAATMPRELAMRVKASLRETPALADLDAAVTLELERQTWSFEQGFFSAP
jgi:enoyl-CoA hydratase